MTAGEVAGLVREHADDLVRRLRLQDRAGIDEDAAAVSDEGVEADIVDDHHLDVLLLEACGAQDRAGVVAQQLLGLGVTDQRDAALRHGRHRRSRSRQGGGEREDPGDPAMGRDGEHGAIDNDWLMASRGDMSLNRRIRLVRGTPVVPFQHSHGRHFCGCWNDKDH